MAYAYVLRSSEDGLLGVFTGSKQAHNAAEIYLNQRGGFDQDEKHVSEWCTYYYANQMTLEVEKFPLNKLCS